jgi:hypothetical protein
MSKLCFFSSALIMCLFLPLVFQAGGKKIEIGGYVLDGQNRPIPDATVSVFYAPYYNEPDAIRDFGGTWKTLDDGLFGIEMRWRSTMKLNLLVDLKNDEAFYPINLKELLRYKLVEPIVILKYEKKISLGNIRSYIKYEKVVIDTQNCAKSFLSGIKVFSYFLKIKDFRGNTIHYGSFGANALKTTQNLDFYLPKGTWFVEIIDQSQNITILPEQKLQIREAETVNLKLDKEVCTE